MKKICVIDDDSLIVATVKRALTKSGYEVSTTSDLEGFKVLADRKNFDLVITDYNLGVYTALDIWKELITKTPFTKMLIMTGRDLPEGIHIPWIRKPFSIMELRKVVSELLSCGKYES